MSAAASILVVDDEQRSLESIQRILYDRFDVHIANNIEDAETVLRREWIQVLLCDQRMPDMSGVEFSEKVRTEYPDIVRMIISGYTEAGDIIDAVNKGGIYQYITKPWHPDDLILKLNNAVKLFKLQRENEQLAVEL
ncbi:MAG: response regulator, partial [Gammaproteobacteria bacterium]|nr:response regulator [Gammaproteobacteria bacterium]